MLPHKPSQPQPTPNTMAHTDTPCLHEGDISILKATMLEVKDNLKSITALLTSNAVLEEQVATLQRVNENIGLRLSTLELSVAKQKGSHHWMDRIVWAVAALGIAGLFAFK